MSVVGSQEFVLPGYNRPVYAPRTILSISVSPGRTLSKLLLRILPPNTMAKCSFVSKLLVYKCNHISVPEVVGIRARTRHSTIGRAGIWDCVNGVEGFKGDKFACPNWPGPWDGRNSGEGGTEPLDRATWFEDPLGRRWALSQCGILVRPWGGVVATDDTGADIVVMCNDRSCSQIFDFRGTKLKGQIDSGLGNPY